MQLPAIATIDQATALLAQLEVALGVADASEKGLAVQVDASGVQEFDTSLLAWLLQAKRRCTAMGRALQVSGAPAKMNELARLYGVEDLLPLV